MPGRSLQKPKLFKCLYFTRHSCSSQDFLPSAAVITSKACSMTASSTSSVMAQRIAAGVRLLQNGVAAVSALALCHLCPQGRTVSYHGSDTQLAVLLGISLNRMDKKDRSGVNVNRSADDVVLELRFADLRGRNDNDVMDARVRVCVHDFHQIGRSAVAPAALFSRCFRGQDAVLCCPLADRHVGRRANSCHQLRHQSIQAVYCGVVTHPRHRPVYQSTTGVPGREPHTWPGHSGTERFPPQSD